MALTHLFCKLAKSTTPLSKDELTDGQLLQRFRSGHDDDAFEELVRRHARLVLSVCRRVLHHNQDTEDAFQGTFLVLARKSDTITKSTSLASWLYKVAYRIALRARANRAKRESEENRLREKSSAAEPGATKDDWTSLVDEEVRRLPEKYRTPILLCYLQGQTNEEAARQMACPTGTVKVRLMRARELLRKRLERRGVPIALSLLLVAWQETASAAVSPALQQSTLEAVGNRSQVASHLAHGQTTTAHRLLEGWGRRIAVAKIKLAAAFLLIIALVLSADYLLQKARSETAMENPSKMRPLSPDDWPDSFSCPQPDFVMADTNAFQRNSAV